ncbi:ribonuclease HII [Leptolyngbya iicbica LK]|uniref:Ribonuclease HII n=3 Tax=Cyanophyceae TaxID=3028117 RepID=A0A4Q7EIP7_9CYAN|nr:ribonuclease HII [Leptolyngbya sp. LK]RZM83047.1 ribonuclease HII [Leptolyngbya sp. LK]
MVKVRNTSVAITPTLASTPAAIIAGVDEVGRGALFGPVVAGAVILDASTSADLATLGVTDSKRLTAPRREALVPQIKSQARAYALGLATVHEIDRLNILQASLLAMRRAICRLSVAPELCLVDGNQRIPDLAVPQQTVVKGDQVDVAIAAASILAKVWRDALIVRLDRRYPGYDLASNKGYGSARHREAIARLGRSPQHRQSFKVAQQLSLLPEPGRSH